MATLVLVSLFLIALFTDPRDQATFQDNTAALTCPPWKAKAKDSDYEI